MLIKVGTRGSKLALTQTNWVINELKKKNPSLKFQIKEIKTKGDVLNNISLEKLGDKGLFVKEIEEELLNNEIDIAIHSMKDMPSSLPKGLIFAKPPKREDPSDVLITPHSINSINDLPLGATIGTGSKRRKYQLQILRNDLKVVSIRGNVDTRIKKMIDLKLDGIILASAGINRLGIESNNVYKVIKIATDDILPAPAQGILAIELKEDKTKLLDIVNSIADETTFIQCVAERSFLATIGGNCHMPIGAYCHILKDEIKLTGLLGSEDGTNLKKESITGTINNAEFLGVKLGNQIKS